MTRIMLFCKKCDEELKYEIVGSGEELVIDVHPCPDCLDKKYDKGYDDGYTAADEEGYR